MPEVEQRSSVTALDMDPIAAQIRQVYFFDTPGLALNEAGIVVRARRVQSKGDDSVFKLRPVVPDELPRALRRLPGFGIEVDALPGGFVCSGSMKNLLGPSTVKQAITGDRPLRKLFSREQRDFFTRYAPEGIGLEDLSTLGPIFVLKLKFSPKGFDRRLVAEFWLYPDDSRILELSTKCPPRDAFTAAAEMRAFLAGRGVDLSGEQETKTRRALEFFSAKIAAGTTA